MNRNDKIVLAQILISFVIGVWFTLYSVALTRKDKAAKQLKTDALEYAKKEVIRLIIDGEIRTREDVDTEFQFAYMNYRAHH